MFLSGNFLERRWAKHYCCLQTAKGWRKRHIYSMGFRRKNRGQAQEVTWRNSQRNSRKPFFLPMKWFEITSLNLLAELQASAAQMKFIWSVLQLAPSPVLLISVLPPLPHHPLPPSKQAAGDHHRLLPLFQVQQLSHDCHTLALPSTSLGFSPLPLS